MDTEFQFGKVESGDGWWCLHNNVSIINATLHLKMVKMLNFMLCIFYYNNKCFKNLQKPKKSITKKYILYDPFYEILKHVEWIYGDRNQNIDWPGWGIYGEGEWGNIWKCWKCSITDLVCVHIQV